MPGNGELRFTTTWVPLQSPNSCPKFWNKRPDSESATCVPFQFPFRVRGIDEGVEGKQPSRTPESGTRQTQTEESGGTALKRWIAACHGLETPLGVGWGP